MFPYQFDQLRATVEEIIRQHVNEETWEWMKQKGAPENGAASLNTLFVSLPRKTGKARIRLTENQDKLIQDSRPGIAVSEWPIDRLCRVWVLMNAWRDDKNVYFRLVENLFLAAEMNELVALYAALPFLPCPELWVKRCSEGIRNNIADVLQAIMCHNPYPSEYLDQPAWNQLVLKAFFTEKPIDRIIGLDSRANMELALILSDYAHERWSAHRPVNPQLWRCVGPFINDSLFPDIEKVFREGDEFEKEAAALACRDSHYLPAKSLLDKNKNLTSAMDSGKLTWNILADKMYHHVLQQ